MASQLNVANMKCNGCVSTVKAEIEKFAGVTAVEVNLEQQSATIAGDADIESLINKLSAMGFPASVSDD